MTTSPSTTTKTQARTGKIARLPRALREQLNRRLEDGESAVTLLPWLNEQPSVQEILAAQFDARPVSAQNLSDWRNGGFQDWLHQEEEFTLAQSILEDADGFTAAHLDSSSSSSSSSSSPFSSGDDREASPVGLPLADRLSAMTALAVAKVIRRHSRGDLESPQSEKALLHAVNILSRLRHGDHRAVRLKMDLLRWEEQKAEIRREAHDRARLAAKSRQTAPVESRVALPPGSPPFDTTQPPKVETLGSYLAKLTGADRYGAPQDFGDDDPPLEDFLRELPGFVAPASPVESTPIKANQAPSSLSSLHPSGQTVHDPRPEDQPGACCDPHRGQKIGGDFPPLAAEVVQE